MSKKIQIGFLNQPWQYISGLVLKFEQPQEIEKSAYSEKGDKT